MKTFEDIWRFLDENKTDTIIPFLEEPWQGKDKQETLFRFFNFLCIIPEFKKYNISRSNFSKGESIKKIKSIENILKSNIKDKGDVSDLTINKKKLIITTSKNLTNYHLGDLDIDKINSRFEKF